MNMLLIIVGLIFIVSIVVGYTRGLIRIAASLGATIAIILIVMIVSPFVSKLILKTIPIEKTMQKQCMELLLGEKAEETELNVELSRDEQIMLIEEADVPDIFKGLLLENNNSEIYKSLGVTYFFEYVGSYVAKLIADMLAFLLTFIVVSIIVRSILYVLGIIGDLPLIGGVNRIAGAAVGLGTGLVIVWVLFIVITLLYNTGIGAKCLADVADNSFLTFLYDKNILMNIVTKFR